MRAAVARAVEAVLSSRAAFAHLVRRLEAAGWRIEREPDDEKPSRDSVRDASEHERVAFAGGSRLTARSRAR